MWKDFQQLRMIVYYGSDDIRPTLLKDFPTASNDSMLRQRRYQRQMWHANVRTETWSERIEEFLLARIMTGHYLQTKLPSTVIRGVHDSLNMKHNQAQRSNEWLYEYLRHN
jgi:hypothetical protein